MGAFGMALLLWLAVKPTPIVPITAMATPMRSIVRKISLR